jgi:KDO2-lipid IV(A) lauroyltransferase
VEKHLALAFPDRSFEWRERVSLESYRHFGREGLVFLRCSGAAKYGFQKDVEISGLEVLGESLRKGSGVMLISGHLGNWEVGAISLAAKGIPIDVVMQDQRNPLVDSYLAKLRSDAGVGVIHTSQGAYSVLESLRSGRVVAWLGDQNPVGNSTMLDFLGVPSRVAKEAAILTLRAGATYFFASSLVVPGVPKKYKVELKKIAIPRRQSRTKITEQLTEESTRLLEAAIRSNPDQYLWHHRRWKNGVEWLRKEGYSC